jgi:glyceraldehyde 3-phosphate dehydrogenase
MSKKKIAINGFGRIGRAAFKIIMARDDMEVVAINDLTSAATLAQLLKYDSIYGRYDKVVDSDETNLLVAGLTIPVFAEKDPAALSWRSLGVDVVLECTGVFRTKALAELHIKAGAKGVVISAPSKSSDIPTIVLGVSKQDKLSSVISNASCTTNCIAPIAQIIEQELGVQKATMTTIHSYTADQNLVDGPHKDLRRARAAALNIVPTSTGAATATSEVVPELKGLFDGLSVRVPTACGSLADFTFLVKKKTTIEEVNNILKKAAASSRYKGILEVSSDPLVSSDIIRNSASAIVDLELTNVIDRDLVKIIAWYDNEWGYSNRLVEIANLIN